jgi:predicted ATP-grasp superfamily ATP-dependent carboligase
MPKDSSVLTDTSEALAATAVGNGKIAAIDSISSPPRVLMIATDFTTPYRVLRCAHSCGAKVFVLGNAAVRPFSFSRYCERVVVSDRIIHGGRDEALALEINCLARELRIDVVMPADAPSVRAVIASRDLIDPRCFPLPGLDQFDALNNKWAFARLCAELDIRHPSTHLVPDAAALASDIAGGALQYPLIVKPLDRCASGGVVILDGVDSEKRLSTINYKPVLAQAFISGRDIGASVYAKAGKVEAFIAHWYDRGVYCTFPDDRIYADVARIMERYDLDGVYNFDMILATDGSIHYLECNPRFFYKINLSMIAGVNFVQRGIPGASLKEIDSMSPGVQVRFPKALLRSLLSSGRCTKRDWALFKYLFSDPWPYLMERVHLTV